MSKIWAQEQINRLRAQYPEGTRIQVDSIRFEEAYQLPDRGKRNVAYMNKGELLREIAVKYEQREEVLEDFEETEHLPKRTVVRVGDGR